jgi:hypothetical protein
MNPQHKADFSHPSDADWEPAAPSAAPAAAAARAGSPGAVLDAATAAAAAGDPDMTPREYQAGDPDIELFAVKATIPSSLAESPDKSLSNFIYMYGMEAYAIKINFAPGFNIIEFRYLHHDDGVDYEYGIKIKKEDIVDYAKITETKIQIKPKKFMIDGKIYDNIDNKGKYIPLHIEFNISYETDMLKAYLDKEPRVVDVTPRRGGKIMKYKLNKKNKSISKRLNKRRKTSKRRKISKRKNKSKRRK